MARHNAAKEEPAVTPIRRDTAGLRGAMFDEIDAMRQGTSDSSRANAISRLCSTIFDSVRVEIEVRKFLQSAPKTLDADSLALGAPVELGE